MGEARGPAHDRLNEAAARLRRARQAYASTVSSSQADWNAANAARDRGRLEDVLARRQRALSEVEAAEAEFQSACDPLKLALDYFQADPPAEGVDPSQRDTDVTQEGE
jgi:multidrug efflux pump subunit AcrA (membrane-fusion protein)